MLTITQVHFVLAKPRTFLKIYQPMLIIISMEQGI